MDGKINDHSRRVSEDYNTTINSYSMISSSPSNKGRGPALSTTEAGSPRIRVSANNRSSAALLAALSDESSEDEEAVVFRRKATQYGCVRIEIDKVEITCNA